jgi:hypothetical protein
MMRFVFSLLFAAALAFAQLPAGKTVVGSYALGSGSLTTTNAIPIVASAGTIGQSDVTLASGIFSRAGALGLATSGANSITLAPGGTTMLTLTSTGGATFYNPTAVTGVTGPFVVRAGAGQSSTALFKYQLSDATDAMNFYDNGISMGFISTNNVSRYYTFGSDRKGLTIVTGGGTGSSLKFDNLGLLIWSSDSGLGANDLGLARNAAGVIEVNNGTAGTYRDLLSRSVIGTATAVATLANSQFTFHLASNTELVVTAKGDDGVSRSVALTLA